MKRKEKLILKRESLKSSIKYIPNMNLIITEINDYFKFI